MSEALDIMDAHCGVDPQWDRARELLATGRRAARELAAEIERLRDSYIGEGKARRMQNLKKGDSPKVTNVTFGNTNDLGFSAKLQEELGLHRETARRLLMDVGRERELRLIAAGELEVVKESVAGKELERDVTPEVVEAARGALLELEADPRMRAARAWAGIWGKAATAGRERAPTNHFVNIAAAIGKLKNSLRPQVMNKLPADQFAELEKMWRDMASLIPERWRK